MSGVIQTGAPFPPNAPVTVTKTLLSYIYQQYADDDNLQLTRGAYNAATQTYIDWFATVNLPYYPGIADQLLTWVATGLYGIPRPILTIATINYAVGYDGIGYNTTAYNEGEESGVLSYSPVTDDVYRRVLTWHLYRGDGWQFNLPWLKKRVHRFLTGENGLNVDDGQTYDVSVSFSTGTFIITISNTPIGLIFKRLVVEGFLSLPFEYDFNVVLV